MRMYSEIFVQINQTNFPAHEAKLITTDPINSIVRARLHVQEFVNFANGREFCSTISHKIRTHAFISIAKYETNIHITDTRIFRDEILSVYILLWSFWFCKIKRQPRVRFSTSFFSPISKFAITNSVDLFDKCKFLRFVYKFVHGRGILNGCIVQPGRVVENVKYDVEGRNSEILCFRAR